MKNPQALRPERLRHIEKPFGWIPFRLFSSGLFAQMSIPARQVYFFLCLVASRTGMSFYSDFRLSVLLKMSSTELSMARKELCDRDLVAYDGRVYQVLSLPETSATSRDAPTDTSHIKSILTRLGIE